MNQPGRSEAWRPISDLLGDSGPGTGLAQLFPASTIRLSILESLGSPFVAADRQQAKRGVELRQSLDGILRQLKVFESIRRCPILAITGLLNAGKSSLLASFLSPENRSRVLRGTSNNAGTHRFVLWLPEVWREEPEMLQTLITFLTSVFGHPPEELSNDPSVAALQYNGHIRSSALLFPDDGVLEATPVSLDPLAIPLIAYDSGLNRLKLGLVDCPDIQTGYLDASTRMVQGGLASARADVAGEGLAVQRRSHLETMGRICSAFLVVSKMSSLHDDSLLRIFITLRDAVPLVPRFLAVNKIKARYSPDIVVEEARGLAERFSISRVYVAYDYRSASADRWIPSQPTELELRADEQLPIFFDAQPIAAGKRQNYLFDLGSQLDVGTLARESNRSLGLQLKNSVLGTIEWLEANQRTRREKLRDAWQAVAAACLDVMAERDGLGTTVGLRLQASPTIVTQLADSLQRTAPLWMQPSLMIDKSMRQLHKAAADSASRFKILQNASDSVLNFAKRFRRGEGASVLTASRLAESIRSFDRYNALVDCGQPAMTSACDHAMARFAEEDKSALNDQELDAWSLEVWKRMTFKDKLHRGLQPIAMFLAPLLAFVLIPIDVGGTAVLVFASAKELLAAAGIAAILGPLTTGQAALKIVHRETPWRQLSDLFAIVCDSLGLPRPPADQLPCLPSGGEQRQLVVSQLESKLHADCSAHYDWSIAPESVEKLHFYLQQL